MSIKGTGQEVEFGIIPATTWHTAVNLAAGSKMKIDSLGPLRLIQDIITDKTMGTDFIRRQDLGRIMQEITFAGPLRYENAQWTHILQAIGTESGSVADTTYTHAVDIDAEIDGVFYTGAAIIRDSTLGSSELFEWPSVKPVSWEITTGSDGFMEFTSTGIADILFDNSNGASIQNSTTTVGTTSTVGAQNLRIPFGHCRINLNDQDGADFNASGEGTDRIFPIAVSISFNRPIGRDFDANRLAADSGNADSYKTSEPQQTGTIEDILITFEFSETVNNDYIEEIVANTAKKCEIYFYSTAARSLKFQFPNLLYQDLSVEPSGMERIPQIVTFRANEVSDGSSAPTGMTGITKPMRCTLINSWSKNYVTNAAIV